MRADSNGSHVDVRHPIIGFLRPQAFLRPMKRIYVLRRIESVPVLHIFTAYSGDYAVTQCKKPRFDVLAVVVWQGYGANLLMPERATAEVGTHVDLV